MKFSGGWARDIEKAHALGGLALAYIAKGEIEQALAYLEESLKIFREVGDTRGEALGLRVKGSIYQDKGDEKRALESFDRAAEIFGELGDRQFEAASLKDAGTAYASLGKADEASRYLEKALQISRSVDDRRQEAYILGLIGFLTNTADKAIGYFTQALAIFRDIDDHLGQALALKMIGLLCRDMGDLEKALESLEQALLIFQALGSNQGEVDTLGRMNEIYSQIALEIKEQKHSRDEEMGWW